MPISIAAPIAAQQCATNAKPFQDDLALSDAQSASVKKSFGLTSAAAPILCLLPGDTFSPVAGNSACRNPSIEMTHHEQAAAWLLNARNTGPGAPLPEAIRPPTEADAYAIQALVMAELGPIGGWKVGAPGPAAAPNCAPMPASGIFASPATLDPALFTLREVESEIAFLLGADLPVRPTPYTEAEVLAAVASCHAAIEVLQPRFESPEEVDGLSHLADLIRHGAFIYGPPIADWQHIDFPALPITQTIEGGHTIASLGNPAGDMMRLMVWLANVGAAWAGGLKARQIVTCGSWTGRTPAPAGALVTTAFQGIAPVTVHF